MKNNKITIMIFSVALCLIALNTALFAAPPLPARLGGIVGFNGSQLTQGSDTGYILKVTKENGTPYNPAAEDSDGLNTLDWYTIDVPIYESTDQPGGATPGETAVIHGYLNGTELNVTSPANGKFQVGNSGTIQQIDIVARTNNLPSMPNLISPLNGQTGMGTTVSFKWGKCTDPDSDTVSYNLYYSDDPDFIGVAPIQVASPGNKGVYYAETGLGLLLFGIVFASGVRNRKNLLPIVIMIVIYTMLFTSCGSGGGGGGGGGPDPDPTPTPTPSPVITEVTQTVSGLQTNTTYYWKVISDDGKGGVMESSTYSFTTD